MATTRTNHPETERERMIPQRTGNGGTELPERRMPSGTLVPEHLARDAHLSELMGGIARDTQRIVSGYIDLAKHDLRGEIDHARTALISAGVGLGALGTGLLVLVLAVSHGLAAVTVLSLGWSYAIVGGAVFIAGAIALLVARSAGKKAATLPPSAREAKEDIKWIKESV